MCQSSVPLGDSVMLARMWSPGRTFMLEIVIEGAGISSHQAEYDALPDAETSCSVPVWIRVSSPLVHLASVQPPPMPIQVEDDSDCPFVCWRALGTVQSPAIE